ncbi:unnamed protein product [Cylindrotheca closterium]|uniref:RWD domain-containing protein n=1 Tax=Cylindrotheca closterium TaxID=2856 RepID=A0AAD2CXB8_9STRA|nr:unnamed protein product [Cylindrotheca closterium]
MSSSTTRSRQTAMPKSWILMVTLLLDTHVSSLQTQRLFYDATRTCRSPTTTMSTSYFTPSVKSPLPPQCGRNRKNLIRHAIIYGDDGEYQTEEEFDASELLAEQDLKQSVSDRIYSEFPPAVLINIACAQAAPPHNHLMPKDCLSAELVAVNTRGAQIAVSTLASAGGEGDGHCVQLLIPIQFSATKSELSPPPSTEASLTLDYIVQQFQHLESDSIKTIAKKEWEDDNADQFAAQEKILFELQNEATLTEELLPDWWTFCELNKGLEEEADNMKELLNEDDFATDLNVLFQTNYHHDSDSPTIQPIKTCVTSIGPSGVYLRSYVERQEEVDDKYFVAKLSVPFPEKTSSRDDLRLSILKMIENAAEQVVARGEEEELLLVETASATIVQGVSSKKAYVFQEQLLRARIQVDQLASKRRHAQKEEALHRSLLATKLSIEQKQAKSPVATEEGVKTTPSPPPSKQQQQQSLSKSTEKELADKYASIEDVGERAYTILKDLNMI